MLFDVTRDRRRYPFVNIAGQVLEPIRRITDHARTASAANLSERIALDGPDDELRELADTVDSMLDRIQSAFDAQRVFSAQASHELRTPLSVIRVRIWVRRVSPCCARSM